MAKKEREPVTLPHISRREAAAFWGLGIPKWTAMLNRGRYGEIRSFKNQLGTRYVLIDVIEAAFPEADDRTRYMIAYHYLKDAKMRRVQQWRKEVREEANHGA